MKMEDLQFLKQCEEQLLGYLEEYVDNFANEIITDIAVNTEQTSSMELLIISKNNFRAIQIIISIGLNINGEQFYGIRFYVQRLDQFYNKIAEFSMKDYCKQMNLDVELTWYFIGISDFNRRLADYLESVLKILSLDQLKRILFCGEWIEIKPDMSPYK